jgi:hypothetical protein
MNAFLTNSGKHAAIKMLLCLVRPLSQLTAFSEYGIITAIILE